MQSMERLLKDTVEAALSEQETKEALDMVDGKARTNSSGVSYERKSLSIMIFA
jgi:hypothetical protein